MPLSYGIVDTCLTSCLYRFSVGIFHNHVKFHGIKHDFVRLFLLKLLSLAAPRPAMSYGFLLASQTSTPRLTPPGSPPSLSASVSPTRTSKPASPRRHAMSFSSSRGMFDERSSIFSSVPSGHHGSMPSSESGSYTGKPHRYSKVPVQFNE